jgi:hypothetical protein
MLEDKLLLIEKDKGTEKLKNVYQISKLISLNLLKIDYYI